ncbi:hypothetical protein [Massilia sp. YIM B04103]|uniref:hypothetical protein n=1 Tax=Massilia sp. YIM B04103 TaxID=2963106 RepID=UPI00210B8755|nr:hypothetical protein [Massilia sp. YIM B04103]
MTIPRKKSRLIEVDAVRYRYVISKSGADDDGHFKLNLTIQIESGDGSILKVEGLRSRDYWLDFPHIESSDKYLSMKPGQVAAIIRRALDQGWCSQKSGAPFPLQM